MVYRSEHRASPTAARKTAVVLWLSVVFFFCLSAGETAAQQRFQRTYPAGRDVRIQLTNRTGTVTVQGWDRNEVAVTARLERPAANINPQMVEGTITINLVKDNQGRMDIGNVNFEIRVPYDSRVDIETKIGNLNVSNVRGGLVRAYISTEGDITLTNIGSIAVAAENVTGDIFFDGDLMPGGHYRFTSVLGNINLRIPFNSSFKLVATAPSTRSIALGSFSNPQMNFLGDGRRVVGKFGAGAATLMVTNQRGSIQFHRR